LGLILLSWIFSIACTTACTFVKITQTSNGLFGYDPDQYEFSFGLRRVEIAGECYSTVDTIEAHILTAFAFGVLNCLLTSAALIGVALVLFNVFKDVEKAKNVWKIMGFLMLASTWCCLFTFYIQQAVSCTGLAIYVGVECSLGDAGIAQVFNSIFLIGICVLFFVLPPPAVEGSENNNDDKKDTKDDNEEKKEKASEEEPTKSKDESEEEKEDEEEGDIVNGEEEE
jgi:hypothetical protein